MSAHSDIRVLAARRSPIGACGGRFADQPATALGAAAIRAAVQSAGVDPRAVDEVLMGCVLQAGLGQAPARQAARAAGLPDAVPATTINKVCGSGMKAVMLGCDMLRAGSARLLVAGGMESMSNAPHLLAAARGGLGTGHRPLLDHMFRDGLENADDGLLMGCFAERCVDRLGLTREVQDRQAESSLARALAAQREGAFDAELCDAGGGGALEDEIPQRCDPQRIRTLAPAFRTDGGTVTAASSAAIADGAAALVIATGTAAADASPVARLVGQAAWAGPPADFPTAPVHAIRRLYRATGWHAADVDLYEINEAFAAVVLAAVQALELDPDKVNVHGGASALGHPIGATGARLLVTLIHALRRRGLRRGIAALCIGGGEATAVAVEVD